jgi:multimeric flavodoxin WrbA
MKILAVIGSPRKQGNIEILLEVILRDAMIKGVSLWAAYRDVSHVL